MTILRDANPIEMGSMFLQPEDEQTAMPKPHEVPSFLDTMASAARLANPLVNDAIVNPVSRFIEQAMNSKWVMDDQGLRLDASGDPGDLSVKAAAPVAGYRPMADPQTEHMSPEDYRHLYGSQSPEETTRRIRQLGRQRQDEQIIADHGGAGIAAVAAMSFSDPLLLMAAALPLAGPASLSRLERVGSVVAGTLALSTTSEAVLHQQNLARTGEESAWNIGVDVLLTAALGSWATRMTKAEQAALLESYVKRAEQESTAGAMARNTGDTLEGEAPAGAAARLVSKTFGRISPLDRVLDSPSLDARKLMSEIAEVPFLQQKNLEGKPTIGSIEAEIEREKDRRNLERHANFDYAYDKYAQREGKNAVTEAEFSVEVSKAGRRKDLSPIPEASELSRHMRKQLDADKETLKAMGEEIDDDVLGADSYYPKMIDTGEVLNKQGEYEAKMREQFANNPRLVKETAEVKSARTRMGEGDGQSRLDEVGATYSAAKDARKAALGEVDANRKAKGVAVRELRQAERAVDNVDQRLTELETQLQHVGDDVAGATEAQMIKLQGGLKADIERTRVKGIKAEEVRQKWQDAATEAEQSTVRLKKAAKAASGAAKEAKKAADAVKADAAMVAKFEKDRVAAATEVRDPAVIAESVREHIDHVLGLARGVVDIGNPSHPRPLRSRTLNVRDEHMEEFLVNDFHEVMSGYTSSMVPAIMLRRRFQSTDLAAEFEEIRKSYSKLREAAPTEKQRASLAKREARDLEDLRGVLSRVKGQAGPSPQRTWALNLVRVARIGRQYNYVRSLGGQTLSSMSDLGHVVSRYGLGKTGVAMAKFLSSPEFNKATRADSKRMGAALQFVLDMMPNRFSDISDDLIAGKSKLASLERAGQRASQLFTKVSLQATWNNTVENLASVLEQDMILRGALNPGSLSRFQRGVLANAGFDDDNLRLLAEQATKYADDSDGFWRGRTEMWDNQIVAKKLEAAVVRAGRVMTISKSAADLPLMMDNEAVKQLMQFKSFGMVAVNRLMIPLVQGLAHGDAAAANGLAVMIALGGMTYVSKQKAAGLEPDLALYEVPGLGIKLPTRLMAEAMQWSGALAIVPDFWDPATLFMPEPLKSARFSRFKDNVPLGTLLGPTFGMATQVIEAANDATGAGGIKADNVHQFRKLWPAQNLFYTRRLVNALEGEFAELVGAEGATNQTFWDRVTETRAPTN